MNCLQLNNWKKCMLRRLSTTSFWCIYWLCYSIFSSSLVQWRRKKLLGLNLYYILLLCGHHFVCVWESPVVRVKSYRPSLSSVWSCACPVDPQEVQPRDPLQLPHGRGEQRVTGWNQPSCNDYLPPWATQGQPLSQPCSHPGVPFVL